MRCSWRIHDPVGSELHVLPHVPTLSPNMSVVYEEILQSADGSEGRGGGSLGQGGVAEGGKLGGHRWGRPESCIL